MNKIILAAFFFLAAPVAHPADPPPPSSPAAPPLLVDSEAILQHWTLPAVPASLPSNLGQFFSVRLRAIVDPAGKVSAARVLQSPDPRLDEPALAAIRTWTFSPEQQDSKPVAVCFDVVVPFDAGPVAAVGKGGGKAKANRAARPQLFRSPVEAASTETMVDADYPDELLARKLPGIVQFVCSVDAEGHRSKLTVIRATHVAFVLPALAVHWTFAPPSGGQADSADYAVIEELVKAAQAGKIAAAAGLDRKLRPIFRLPPVYPANLLGEGRPAGETTINVVIARDGRVRLPRVVSASREEFGWAAAAAAAQWVFEPPMKGGKPIDVQVQVPFRFEPPPEG